eukprot:9470811-Pyramimonas_sp.AAC.1
MSRARRLLPGGRKGANFEDVASGLSVLVARPVCAQSRFRGCLERHAGFQRGRQRRSLESIPIARPPCALTLRP